MFLRTEAGIAGILGIFGMPVIDCWVENSQRPVRISIGRFCASAGASEQAISAATQDNVRTVVIGVPPFSLISPPPPSLTK